MRFSDEFLRQLKDRASIVDYAGARLAWDRRKSQPARGDYWACCPFHGEKSPSFHVREDRGVYKCFGCGAAGGVIDLAMALEGLSFPEAVERLADFSGLPLPEDPASPVDDAQARLRSRAKAAMAAAAEAYGAALHSPAGAPARAYLAGRGLPEALWAQYGLGYAPGGWTWTLERLQGAGFSEPELAAAGLIRPAEGGRRAFDLFRNRITFRIDDAAGRPIAFGARALDPEENAKYINSPESLLFHKGRTLYALKAARETLARNRSAALIVAEGYLDVIALQRAGFAAVAPLGTALTEDQLALIWRACPEPTLCFDGDKAGVSAAHRVLDLALPQLGPERTLKIALLPAGQDPDDLYRQGGAEALATTLAAARPAVDALFAREQALKPLNTPEAKAGFKARLKAAAGRIQDEETRRLYLAEVLARADAIVRAAPSRGQARHAAVGRASAPPQRGPKGRDAPRYAPPAGPTAALKAAAAQRANDGLERLIGAAVDNPHFAEAHLEALAALPIDDPILAAIRTGLIARVSAGDTLDRAALSTHLAHSGAVDAALRIPHLPGLVQKDSEAADRQAETVRMSLVEAGQEAPETKQTLGATRARVALRAKAREAAVKPRGMSRAQEREAAALLQELSAQAALAEETARLRAAALGKAPGDAGDDPLAATQALLRDQIALERARRDASLEEAP